MGVSLMVINPFKTKFAVGYKVVPKKAIPPK